MEGLEIRAVTSTQLSIDEAILDYLLYTANKSLLAYIQSAINGGLDAEKIELPLQLVDCKISIPKCSYHTSVSNSFCCYSVAFLVMFRCMHPEYHASPELRFRLRLLKYATHSAARFAYSYTSPTASATQALRDRHRKRAEASPYYNRLPDSLNTDTLATSFLSPSFSKSDTTHAKNSLIISSPTGPDSTPDAKSKTTLLDTLPEFMAISASMTMLDARNITETWMRLAAGYMSHAFMEQVLACGNVGICPLLEAFAWGFDEFSNAADGSDEENINVMFLGEDGTLKGWDDLREAHIRAVSTCMRNYRFMSYKLICTAWVAYSSAGYFAASSSRRINCE